MKKYITLILIFIFTAATPTYSQTGREERTKKTLDAISEYMNTMWDNVPVQKTSISKGFSLEGNLVYQVQIEDCDIMNNLFLRIKSANISHIRKDGHKDGIKSITAAIGKKIAEKSWNMFDASEAYIFTKSDITRNGVSIKDKKFLIELSEDCDDLFNRSSSGDKGPAMEKNLPQNLPWIVFKITLNSNASVYAHGPLRPKE